MVYFRYQMTQTTSLDNPFCTNDAPRDPFYDPVTPGEGSRTRRYFFIQISKKIPNVIYTAFY